MVALLVEQKQDSTSYFFFSQEEESRHCLFQTAIYASYKRNPAQQSLYPSHLLRWIALDRIVMTVTLFSVNKVS